MQEAGIDISRNIPKSVSQYLPELGITDYRGAEADRKLSGFL